MAATILVVGCQLPLKCRVFISSSLLTSSRVVPLVLSNATCFPRTLYQHPITCKCLTRESQNAVNIAVRSIYADPPGVSRLALANVLAAEPRKELAAGLSVSRSLLELAIELGPNRVLWLYSVDQ